MSKEFQRKADYLFHQKMCKQVGCRDRFFDAAFLWTKSSMP